MSATGDLWRERSRAEGRERIAIALVEAVAEEGYDALSEERLLERAGCERAEFKRFFASLDECLWQIWEERVGEFLERTGTAFVSGEGWREGMRKAGWAYCRYIQEDRARARFLIEMSYRSEIVQASRDFVMSSYAQLVHMGCEEGGRKPPLATAEGIVGAVWEKVARKIMADEFEALPQEMPRMMFVTVLPYLGESAALEELARADADIASYEAETARLERAVERG